MLAYSFWTQGWLNPLAGGGGGPRNADCLRQKQNGSGRGGWSNISETQALEYPALKRIPKKIIESRSQTITGLWDIVFWLD